MIKSIKSIAGLTILTLLFVQITCGQKIYFVQSMDYASGFLEKMNDRFKSNHTFSENGNYVLSEREETIAYIYNLEPGGFIIISAFNTVNPVIGFSMEGHLPESSQLKETPAFSIIEGIAMSHKHLQYIQPGNDDTDKSVEDEIFGPWLSTIWGQVNCYNDQGNLINVTNYYTPNHYAAGCVAISLSSVLHYYQWPPRGKGYHQYYDGQGSSHGTYEANYGDTYYKWDCMLDAYYNHASTDEEREAAGELAFHAAVALNMDFEYNGSTSNVNQIPATGSNYFRFYSFYKSEGNSVFWPRLDKNVQEANPIILSVENNSGFGHSVICDGLWISDDDRYYHLNMGWWGASNGWYTIQDGFNAGGYTSILGGVLDFIPVTYLDPVQMPNDTNMFHLCWRYTHAIEAEAFEVQRKINSGSWETIAEEYADTSLLIVIDNIEDDYYFRVKAKVNGEYYSSTWSNVVQLDIISAIDENQMENPFEISPNPFTDILNISVPETVNACISIYNMTGKVLYQNNETIIHDQLSLPVKNIEKGIYIIEIKTKKSKQVFKIIKK